MKLALTILIALSFSVCSQTYQPTILEHTFQSDAFGSERKISISLPTGYAETDSSTKYVVAYLFDGQFNPYFSMVSSVIDYYSQISEGIPMIVVSIHTENRSLEFTPKPNNPKTAAGWRGNCGSAEMLTTSLRDEIIPYIESNYRTQPYRLAIGHSLGGTYVLQDIFKDESIFSGVIAVSPNLNYDDEQIVFSGERYFKTHPESRTFLYTSAGDQGNMESSFRRSLQKLDSIHSNLDPKHMDWTCNLLDGDGHMSSFLPTFNYAYLAFNKHWIISEDLLNEMMNRDYESMLDHINEFYNELSLFVGSEVKPTNDDWNNYAYELSYYAKHDDAIQVIEAGIAMYPKDPNLLDSRGEILEEASRFKDAQASYQEAMAVLEANNAIFSEDMFAYYSETFSKNIKRMSDEYVEYKSLIHLASVAADREDYKQAAKHFTKAFKLNIIQATHIDRKMAVSTFAQVKKFDLAFEQLELLANKFKWQGRTIFEEDEMMKPLHADKRWEEMMKLMDKNAEEAGN